MQNFTTQEHPRNHSTVVENPGKTIANLREKQRNRNLVNGVIISAMALGIVVTGSILGSTVAHNQQLKGQLGELTTQNQTLNRQLTEMSAADTPATPDEIPTASYYDRPATRIIDQGDFVPTFTRDNPTTIRPNLTVNDRATDCPDCPPTTEQNTTAPVAGRDRADPTLNPPVMAEPTTMVAAPTDQPDEHPAPLTQQQRLNTPNTDEATPLPRVPSGRHARFW